MPAGSVYVHFPWCLAKCPYCDFVSYARAPGEIEHAGYADAVLRELEARRPRVLERGVVVGSIFGLATFSAVNQQKSDCQSDQSCANHQQALNDHSTASTDGAISSVAFIAGGALIAAGVVLFLTAPRSGEPPSTGLAVSPVVTPGGAAVSLRTSF